MASRPSVVCLSGGIDSTTCLAIARYENPNDEVLCVGIKYPSKHNRYELLAAGYIAEHYECNFHVIDLTQVFEHFSSNLLKHGGDIPEGHYEDETMKSTVVPMRNVIFASIVSAHAMEYFPGAIPIHLYMGVHIGDHAIYPDCRPETIEPLGWALMGASDSRVKLVTPLLQLDKTSIVRHGVNLEAPYVLTRTCYKDQACACGKCGSCVERLEAFANNGIKDPITYE